MNEDDTVERYSHLVFRHFKSSRKHLLCSYRCAFLRMINLQQASLFFHCSYPQILNRRQLVHHFAAMVAGLDGLLWPCSYHQLLSCLRERALWQVPNLDRRAARGVLKNHKYHSSESPCCPSTTRYVLHFQEKLNSML